MKTALWDHSIVSPNRWSRQIIRRATAPGIYHTWTAERGGSGGGGG